MSDSESSVDESTLHPLFWSKLPDEPTEESESYIKTFQSMIYDNKSPDQLAQNFKERGDDIFRQGSKFFDDALDKYTEALEHCSNGSKSNENRVLFAKILSNRAAIHFKKKNYRTVRKDVDRAIAYGILVNEKAYYRGAKAYQALGKAKKAIDEYVLPGLIEFPQSAGLAKLKEELQIQARKEKEERDEKRRKEWNTAKKEKELLGRLVDKPCSFGPLYSDCEALLGLESNANVFRIVETLGYSERTLPFLVLWPEFSRADVLKEVECFSEEMTIEDLINSVLPLPPEYGKGYEKYRRVENVEVDLLVSRAPSESSTLDLSSLNGLKNSWRAAYRPDLYDDCERKRLDKSTKTRSLFPRLVHMVIALEIVVTKSS